MKCLLEEHQSILSLFSNLHSEFAVSVGVVYKPKKQGRSIPNTVIRINGRKLGVCSLEETEG